MRDDMLVQWVQKVVGKIIQTILFSNHVLKGLINVWCQQFQQSPLEDYKLIDNNCKQFTKINSNVLMIRGILQTPNAKMMGDIWLDHESVFLLPWSSWCHSLLAL